MKVSDFIAKNLAERDVSHIFGMSGANIEDLYESIDVLRANTKIILAKNEYNATTMAIGSYISTRKISVVLTTSGPGTLNTIPVLAEAYTSNIPLILISGFVPNDLEGLGAFQDTSGKNGTINIQEMTKHCCVFQTKISEPNYIPEALEKAFYFSKKNKKPSIIYIPKDLFIKDITNFTVSPMPLSEDKSAFENNLPLNLFIEKLNKTISPPPLVILGEECLCLKERSQLVNFINKTGSGVALTPNSKELFDHNHPQFLGLIGIMGHDEVNEYLKKTDSVIMFGVNLNMLNRFGLEELIRSKNILIVKEDKSSDEYIPQADSVYVLYSDMETSLTHLSSQISSKKILEMTKKNSFISNEYEIKNIINKIQKNISPKDNICIDAGNSGAFAVHNLQLSGQGTCYISLGMGGMGNSIGAGIGCAASSKIPTHVFVGDGSFLMYGLELHTAIEHNLPIHFYIFNNNSHGMCSTREDLFFNRESGINNFKHSYFALGFKKIFPSLIAHEVSDLNELTTSLEKTKNHQGPTLISITINNYTIPPFRSFKKITKDTK